MTSSGTDKARYPIRAVARLTGLSVDTLRAWERRYGAVVPQRSDRGRLYTDADVARLRDLGELVRRGYAIGIVARLPDVELRSLLKSADSHVAVAAPEPVANVESMARALDRYDLETIEAMLTRYAVVLPPSMLIFAVIVPLMQDVGRRWSEGSLRPAQEHLVSAVVRSVLGGLLRSVARPNASPRIVLATPVGERHELGLLCAAVLTASAGFGVVYLGVDLPADDIAHAAATSGARIVLLSVTTPGVSARREARRLATLPRDVELWIGGAEATAMLSTIGDRGRHVPTLAELIPMLVRHVQ